MFKKIVCILLSVSLFNVSANAAPQALTPEQIKVVTEAVDAKAQELSSALSDEEVSSRFEGLSVLMLTKEHESSRASMSHSELGEASIEYAALGKVISPEAKKAVYLKLFGTRGVSPFYGQVSQAEFSDDGFSTFIIFFYFGFMMFIIASQARRT